MSSISANQAPSQKELRTFGLILAAGFFAIAMIPAVFRHIGPGRVWLLLSIASAMTGLLSPNLLRSVYRWWMVLGNILGWVNTRILLSLIFYLVVTPVKLIMSVAGNDPMNRKFDPKADTYRVPRKPRDSTHMKHQF